MKISVIIPTYKPKAYLWECLDSICKQTFPKEDFELILVLNGEKEPYDTQIRKYVAEHMSDLNVRYVYTDVAGVSNARNIALDMVRGEYIAFVDDDDYISHEYLNALYKMASLDTISLSDVYAFNDGVPEIQLSYYLTDIYRGFYNCKHISRLSSSIRKYFNAVWAKLIPAHYVKDYRFDGKFKNGEDSLFMFLISDKVQQLSFASNEAIYYRRYRDNSAVTSKRSWCDIVVNGYNLIKAFLTIYCKSPGKYDFFFMLTRVVGVIKSFFS